MRVFIAEDEEQMSLIMAALLLASGQTVVRTKSWAATTKALETGPCDLLILDPGLPDSSPRSSIDRIRELILAGAAKVMIVTAAEITPEILAACMTAGACSVLRKGPDLIRTLVPAVRGC